MLPVSAISDAAVKLRKLLSDQIDDLTVKKVRIGHPKNTFEDMESGDEKQCNHLNLFFYNIQYDGYPADGLSEDPFYVRLYCLITALGAKMNSGPSPGENDLRLAGEVMRVLHEQPILSMDDGNNGEITRLQIVPHPLNLDDINHIWSTQGDTAYRLSVAYEMALVPIPLAKAAEKSPLVGEIGTGGQGDMDRGPLPDSGFSIETSAPVVPKVTVDVKKPDWAPHICFLSVPGSILNYTLLIPVSSLPASGLQLKVLVAGKINKEVDLVWETWTPSIGWEKSSLSKNVTITTDTIAPGNNATGLAIDVELPIQGKGQAALYAERALKRLDGSIVKLRSNPLLVTVHEAVP